MNLPDSVVVLDLETTGLSPQKDGIVEIGAVRISGGVLTDDVFESLVRPTGPNGETISIPKAASDVHGILNHQVVDAPTIAEVLPRFADWAGGVPCVAHNSSFDFKFLAEKAARLGLSWRPQGLCTVQISRRTFPNERSHKLDLLAERLNLSFIEGGRHRSMGDVIVTAHAYLRMRRILAQKQNGPSK